MVLRAQERQISANATQLYTNVCRKTQKWPYEFKSTALKMRPSQLHACVF